MLTVTIVAAQSVPALINYQGRLANPDGSPLPTAEYELSFRVWDAATNGVLKWGPQIFDGTTNGMPGHGSRIPVVQGYFNVMLGPVDTNGAPLIGAFAGTNRFVEVTVTNHSPVLPRQQILSTPFAFQAANSATLAGADWSSILVSGNNPVSGKIRGDKIQDQGITGAQIAGNSISLDRLQPRVQGAGAVGNVYFSPNLTSGTFSAGLGQDAPQLSVAFTSTGRPVLVGLQCQIGSEATLQLFNNGLPYPDITVNLHRNVSTLVASRRFTYSGSGLIGWSPDFLLVDSPAAGPVTYKISLNVVGPAGPVAVLTGVKLVAFEL